MKIIILFLIIGVIHPIFAQESPIDNVTNQLENQITQDNLQELESRVSDIENRPSFDDQFVSGIEYTKLMERLYKLENQKIDDFGQSIQTIAGIAVAGGTIALAAATFLMIRQSNSQLKEFRRQNHITISKNEPILKVNNLRFVGNNIQCTIRNIGKGIAMYVGLSTRFEPTIENMPNVFSKLTLNGEHVRPSEIINFQISEHGMVLDHKETGLFVSELLFGVGIKSKIGNQEVLITRQALTFDELKEFLSKHGITSVAMDLSVISKDVLENPIDPSRIAKFFVDFKKHSTLQEAYDAGITKNDEPYFFALSQEELEWQDGEIYRNARSSRKSEI